MSLQKTVFSSAVSGTDYPSFTKIGVSGSAASCKGAQVARFFVEGALSSGTDVGEITLVLLKDGLPIFHDIATVTKTAIASGSGRLVATVAFAKSTSEKIDLLGYWRSGAASRDGYEWKYAVTDLGSFTSLSVTVATSTEL